MLMESWRAHLKEIAVRHSSEKGPFLESFLDRYEKWFDVFLLDLHNRKKTLESDQTLVKLALPEYSDSKASNKFFDKTDVPELKNDVERFANGFGWHINSWDARIAVVDIVFSKIYTDKMYKDELLKNKIRRAYHVTSPRNLASIKRNGLMVMKNSKETHNSEYPKRIYLWIGDKELVKDDATMIAFGGGLTTAKVVAADAALFITIDVAKLPPDFVVYNDPEFQSPHIKKAVYTTMNIPPEALIDFETITDDYEELDE